MKTQDFARFQTSTQVVPARTQIIIPAFMLAAPTWSGASTIIAGYLIGNTDYYFSIKKPIIEFGENFMLAIQWHLDGVAYRYKLWDNDNGVLYYPVYNGEKIGLNAVLEVWSINSAEAPVLDDDTILYSSILNFPSDCSCTPPAESLVLSQRAPTVINPYAFCNPFCEDLCEL